MMNEINYNKYANMCCDNWLLVSILTLCSQLFWVVVVTTFLIQSIDNNSSTNIPETPHEDVISSINHTNDVSDNKQEGINNDKCEKGIINSDYEPEEDDDDSDSDYEPEEDEEDDDSDSDYEPEEDIMEYTPCVGEIKKVLGETLKNVKNTRELLNRVLVKR